MNSFYTSVAGSVGETCPLTAEDARHACSVLRLRTGDAVYCVDPEGRRFAPLSALCFINISQTFPSVFFYLPGFQSGIIYSSGLFGGFG